jgi:spermidine synthase
MLELNQVPESDRHGRYFLVVAEVDENLLAVETKHLDDPARGREQDPRRSWHFKRSGKL